MRENEVYMLNLDSLEIEPLPQEMKDFFDNICDEAYEIMLELSMAGYKSFSYGKQNRIKNGLHPKEATIYKTLKEAGRL